MITSRQIEDQCQAYALARQQVDALPDKLERDIGLAALRLEATSTYNQLVTTAADREQGSLVPMREYVAALEGGERVEKLVTTIDKRVTDKASQIAGEATLEPSSDSWLRLPTSCSGWGSTSESLSPPESCRDSL